MCVFIAMRSSWAFIIGLNILSFYRADLFLYSLNLWRYYWLLMVKSSIILWTNRQIAERPTILHVKGWAFVILNRDTTNSEPLYLWNVPIKCFWSFHNAAPFQPWCQHKIQRKTWMCIYKNQWCWSATTCIVSVLHFSLVPTFWSGTKPNPWGLWHNLYLYHNT